MRLFARAIIQPAHRRPDDSHSERCVVFSKNAATNDDPTDKYLVIFYVRIITGCPRLGKQTFCVQHVAHMSHYFRILTTTNCYQCYPSVRRGAGCASYFGTLLKPKLLNQNRQRGWMRETKWLQVGRKTTIHAAEPSWTFTVLWFSIRWVTYPPYLRPTPARQGCSAYIPFNDPQLYSINNGVFVFVVLYPSRMFHSIISSFYID
jgi:hypothetical protein